MDGSRAVVTVVANHPDEESTERLAIALVTELAEASFTATLAISRDECTAGSAPDATPGAKSGALVTSGQLAVAGVASAAALRALVSLLRDWIGRHRNLLVRVEVDGRSVEIRGHSPESTERLLEILSGSDAGS